MSEKIINSEETLDCDNCSTDYINQKEIFSMWSLLQAPDSSVSAFGTSLPGIYCNFDLKKLKCVGGLPKCTNYLNGYKDIEGVACCEECDKYIDENPYDPYWEIMDNEFSSSKEYKELKKKKLLNNEIEEVYLRANRTANKINNQHAKY